MFGSATLIFFDMHSNGIYVNVIFVNFQSVHQQQLFFLLKLNIGKPNKGNFPIFRLFLIILGRPRISSFSGILGKTTLGDILFLFVLNLTDNFISAPNV